MLHGTVEDAHKNGVRISALGKNSGPDIPSLCIYIQYPSLHCSVRGYNRP